MIRAYLAREEKEAERFGRLAFTIARSSGSKKKGGGEFELRDFFQKRPRRSDVDRPRPSVEAMVKFAEMATWAWGGKDLRRGKNDAR